MPKFKTGGRRVARATMSPNIQATLNAAGITGVVGITPRAVRNNPNYVPPQTDNDNGIQVDDEDNGAKSQTFEDFQKMTDDQKAQVLFDALKDKPPSFLPDNDTQRLLWHLEGDNRPTVVSDSQLDAIQGKDLFRQVAGIHDSTLGNDLNSSDIANQILTGDLTMYSDSGGSAYGRAIYFGDSYSEIKNYYGRWNSNRVKGGGNDSTMIRVKVDPKAKSMSYNQMNGAIFREIGSGSKLGKALAKYSSSDRVVAYALAKGIDYSYDTSAGYYMIYNRGCLIASSKTKHNTTDNSW